MLLDRRDSIIVTGADVNWRIKKIRAGLNPRIAITQVVFVCTENGSHVTLQGGLGLYIGQCVQDGLLHDLYGCQGDVIGREIPRYDAFLTRNEVAPEINLKNVVVNVVEVQNG